MPKLETITVKLTVPVVGEIEGVWRPDDSERAAAWEMYVELITRISVVQLKPGEGLLREALTSQYHLFQVTRDILRRYGPVVARPSDRSDLSFGYIAVTILNTVLRPILSSWHPELLAHEGRRHPQESPTEHERRWELSDALRREIDDARTVLMAYADVLADVAGVPSLVPRTGGRDA